MKHKVSKIATEVLFTDLSISNPEKMNMARRKVEIRGGGGLVKATHTFHRVGHDSQWSQQQPLLVTVVTVT